MGWLLSGQNRLMFSRFSLSGCRGSAEGSPNFLPPVLPLDDPVIHKARDGILSFGRGGSRYDARGTKKKAVNGG